MNTQVKSETVALPNPQLYAMTPKQQIIVFSRHTTRTARAAKNLHKHYPLMSMVRRDLCVLWSATNNEKLEKTDRQTAYRCAVAIESMIK